MTILARSRAIPGLTRLFRLSLLLVLLGACAGVVPPAALAAKVPAQRLASKKVIRPPSTKNTNKTAVRRKPVATKPADAHRSIAQGAQRTPTAAAKRGHATAPPPKTGRRGQGKAARAQRNDRVPSPVTVIRAPGLKLTASGRPEAPLRPTRPARVTTVRSPAGRGSADSTRIWIGGQPHDPRYALFIMPGQELKIEAHVSGGLAQKWEGDGSFDPLPPSGSFPKLAAQASAPARKSNRVKVEMPGRTLTWRAPEVPGAAFLTLKTTAPAEQGRGADWKDVARLNIMVMMPAEEMIAGRLNGYLIGSYPLPRTEQDSTYLPPIAFLRANGRPTRLSPNFFLEDFACHQEHEGERFVALQPRLLPFLEAISVRVKELTGTLLASAVDRRSKERKQTSPAPANAKSVDSKSVDPGTVDPIPADSHAPAEDEGGLALAVGQGHEAAEAAARPRKPNLPNRPAPPPSFRSSPGDAMEAAAHPRALPLDMAEVVRARPIKVLSGYRTPAYNRTLGTAKLSRHQYGDACDIFVDRDNDGRMDDLNLDGNVDGRDALTLAAWIEELWQRPEFRACPGGLGVYNSTGAHGPFVHVDLRGFKARWGGNGLRWDDENESARDLLGLACPPASPGWSGPGFATLADDATRLADEEPSISR